MGRVWIVEGVKEGWEEEERVKRGGDKQRKKDKPERPTECESKRE